MFDKPLFCLAFLLLGLYALGEIAIGLFLGWDILLLDFFDVGETTVGLF
jgi:hypothetical protein